MSGYKRVNYYELCRLCTSTEGTKVHIFKEEGRRKLIQIKIKNILPLEINEYDLLPKMICDNCLTKLDEWENFRQLSLEAEKMLLDFRVKLKNSNESDGRLQVYVKDSRSHMTEKLISCEPTTVPSSTAAQQILIKKAEKTVVTRVTLSNAISEDNLPFHCAVPLKLNGVASPAVPVNVDNLSSLVGVMPNREIPRSQSFKLPLQTEVAFINDLNYQRFGVTLSNGEVISKNMVNILQSLQSAVDDDTSAVKTDTLLNNSVAVPIISSSNIQDDTIVRTEVPIKEMIGSCIHCGTIRCDLNDVCNHTIKQPAMFANSAVQNDMDSSLPYKSLSIKKSSEVEGFNCDICLKLFKKKELMLQHRRLHTGERPFICVSCGKSFSRKEHLFRHALAHTGEKRHWCNLCGKTFSRKDNLHKHRKIHGITGPYECELCGKSFIVQHYFLMHLANHGSKDKELPFQCAICKKGFKSEEFLNRHETRQHVENVSQIENSDLAALLSPNVAHQSTIDEIAYISTQPTTFTSSPSIVTSVATTM